MLEDRPTRPAGVTLLALGVLSIAGLNLLRGQQAIVAWDFLQSLPRVSPLYLASSGLVWGLLGLPLAWGLWRGYRWTPRFTLLFVGLYTLYFWLDRLLLTTEGLGVNWPCMAAINIIVILYTWWTLTRPKTRAYFGVRHDR